MTGRGSLLFSINPRGPLIPEATNPGFVIPPFQALRLLCELKDVGNDGLNELLTGEGRGDSRSVSSLRFFARAALFDGLEGAVAELSQSFKRKNPVLTYISELRSTLEPVGPLHRSYNY